MQLPSAASSLRAFPVMKLRYGVQASSRPRRDFNFSRRHSEASPTPPMDGTNAKPTRKGQRQAKSLLTATIPTFTHEKPAYGPSEGILNMETTMTESAIDFFTNPPPADPEPEPKGRPHRIEIKSIHVFDRKREKAHDAAMKLGFAAIDGPSLPSDYFRLTSGDPKEMRTIRQRERRTAKALGSVIL